MLLEVFHGHLTFVRPAVRLQTIKITDDFRRKRGLGCCLGIGVFTLLQSDLSQFAGVEPVAAAIGTFIHFDPAFGAKEMAFEFDACAAWALAFAAKIHLHPRVLPDVEEALSGSFFFLIHALELERVEPDPAAAPLTNVHYETADLGLSQFVETSWTFHKSELELLLLQVYFAAFVSSSINSSLFH